MTVHNFDRLMVSPRLRILNRVYRYADAIIVHSGEQRKTAIDLGIPKHKIKVIPHGAQIVRLLGLDRNRMSFFGAPVERKGFFVLLEALGILKESDIKISLEIFGIYSVHERNDAISAAKKLDVDDLLSWHGRVGELEFDGKMQESMFTFAVYTEDVGGSTIITRAMVNGTPIIASDQGSNREYLGDTGVLVPPGDPQALASAIRELIGSETLLEKLGKRARERAKAFLSWDNVAEETLRTYLIVMERQIRHSPSDR